MESYRNCTRVWGKVLKYTLGIIGVFAVLAAASVSKSNPENDDSTDPESAVTRILLPEKIDFAGENVPLNYFDVKEGLERELLVNSYWHSQTFLLIKRARRYFGIIEPILKKNKVPADFKYLALAESGFANVTSPMGAVGFWQIVSGTAKDYGLEINKEIDERYHIEKSTNAACKFLLDLHKTFGSWTMAAASYNCGAGSLNKQVQRQYSANYYDLLLNDETARYLYRVIALKLVISDPVSYGFNIPESELYQPIPYKEVVVNTPIKDLALFAFENGTNYKILKILNPWLRENVITNLERKSYAIKIPTEGYRDHDKQLTNFDTASTSEISDLKEK